MSTQRPASTPRPTPLQSYYELLMAHASTDDVMTVHEFYGHDARRLYAASTRHLDACDNLS
jgi:4-alpha-glucanotransferase